MASPQLIGLRNESSSFQYSPPPMCFDSVIAKVPFGTTFPAIFAIMSPVKHVELAKIRLGSGQFELKNESWIY